MKILDLRAYRGPNIWSHEPVIKMKLDLEDLEERPSNKIEGFVERLLALMPTLENHRCSPGRHGGLVLRMRDGTWMGHIAEHIALELQNLAGSDVGYGKTFGTDQHAVYNIIYSYLEESVGMEAGKIALEVIEHLAYNRSLDLPSRLEYLSQLVDQFAYGLSTQALVDEALRRNIPVIRLNEGNLVQLGYGAYQKRIQATVTSHTNLISVDIAGDKQMTKSILADIGIPVPSGSIVRTWDEAEAALLQIGFPVVIKPQDGNQGRGVAININRMETAKQAFERAKEFSRSVIIEEYIRGRDFRILVINGEVVAAAERSPARVFGDGIHTVSDLVEIANRNPQRGVGHEKPLSRIVLDEESFRVLRKQDLTPDSTPEPGQEVRLKFTANVSTGGTASDCTDELHHSIREMAVRATKAVGLDVAGLDLVATDITQPLDETQGAICEINAAPGFRMHLHPFEGMRRNVAAPVIDMLFPSGTASRIPVIAVTGTNGKTTTARMIAHILKKAGKKVGLTSTDGVFINGKKIKSGDLTGPWSAQLVLKDPTVDFAVLEAARGGILRAGLGFDQCDVGVITNVAEDHLGLGEVETLEELAYVKSLVLEVVKEDGFSLINVEDPNILRLRSRFKGHHFYFALDKDNEVLQRQIREGGPAIFIEDGVIKIQQRKYELPVIEIRSIPATFEGVATFNVANAMIAVAAAYCSGIKVDDIRAGMRTFQTNFYLSPGRLNLVDCDGFSVLLDYAHNVPALKALGRVIENQEASLRIGVLAVPGDRRDCDIVSFGEIAAKIFDRVVVKEDCDRRGRSPGEVARLLKEGFLAAGGSEDDVETVLDEGAAVDFALHSAGFKNLVVIFCENIGNVWNVVSAFRENARRRVEPVEA